MSINQFAAMTLILHWVQVVGMIMISWAQATGIFIGQLLGRQATDESLDEFLARAWRVAFALAALVSTLYFAASISFRWIYDDLQSETLDALWSFVPALLLLTFPKSSNAICGSTLRAGGDTVHVMNIHLVSQWACRVPLTALFVLSSCSIWSGRLPGFSRCSCLRKYSNFRCFTCASTAGSGGQCLVAVRNHHMPE